MSNKYLLVTRYSLLVTRYSKLFYCLTATPFFVHPVPQNYLDRPLALDHERDEIANAGCDDYLCKPFLLEQLEAKIAFYLNRFSDGIQKWRSRLCG
jgi:hypothetical protein